MINMSTHAGERPCVTPIINGSAYLFKKGKSFFDTFKIANRTAHRISRSMELDLSQLPFDRQILHSIALSAFGVLAFVGYEYARAHGMPLPDILPAIPVASYSGPVGQEYVVVREELEKPEKPERSEKPEKPEKPERIDYSSSEDLDGGRFGSGY